MNTARLSQAVWESRNGERPHRVRIVHLGLGNFHRAHQAWYTAAAPDWREWGIAAFSGRGPLQTELLAAQDGLYCLSIVGAHSSKVVVVPSIVEAIDGACVDRLVALLSDPMVSIVTLTITEAGYRLRRDGSPDLADSVVASDLELLRAASDQGALLSAEPASTLGRLLVGLAARASAGEYPIAIVSCDNIPDNGGIVARGLTAIAEAVAPELARWIVHHASFVSTSVDRITPRVDLPLQNVLDEGWEDDAAVVTEGFTDWVLSGDFPGGRPMWEAAGARFVDDIEPWEDRKLWLLNGAHSILSFAGLERGLETVADAMEDDDCRELVSGFWAEAVTHLPTDIEHERYRADLIERFTNRRIEHQLRQIAGDATPKARIRLAAVAERTVAAGGDAEGSARAIAAWVRAVRAGVLSEGTPPEASGGDAEALLRVLSPALADATAFSKRVCTVALDAGQPGAAPTT